MDDRLVGVGGKQSITTAEGHVIPLASRDGLVYMETHYPTDSDMETLQHVIMTSDVPWDPAKFDNELEDLPDLLDREDEADTDSESSEEPEDFDFDDPTLADCYTTHELNVIYASHASKVDNSNPRR